MVEVRRFTIRPKIKEKESLTGYLIRIANANDTKSFSEIGNLIKKDDVKSFNRNFTYTLDVYPSDMINIQVLSNLLNVPTEKLQLHTFEPFVQLFYPETSGKMVFNKEIDFKHRRFCKSCLKENGVFKFLWQVKEICICDKHLTKLEYKCEKCGSEQPYFPTDTVEYLKCNCGELLYKDPETKIMESDIIDNQLRIYRDWNFIVSPQTFINIFGDSKQFKRKIALLLLYLTFSGKSIASRKNPYLTRNQVKKLINIIKSNSNDYLVLGGILKSLRTLNLELDDISAKTVPMSFIKLILGGKKENSSKPMCTSPWCKSFGSKESIKNIRSSSKGNYLLKANLYKQHHICIDCWVQLGINKESGKWNEINLSQPLLMEIRDLIENGDSVNKISNELKLDYYKIHFYLGYLSRFNMITKSRVLSKNIKNNEIGGEELVQFFELKPFWKNYNLLVRNASRIFGWSPLTTFYYYWSPEVQELIYLDKNNHTSKIENRKQLIEKANKVISDLESSQVHIAVKEVAAALGTDKNVIYYHNLSTDIKDANKRIGTINKNDEGEFIKNRIYSFVNENKKIQQQILKKDIYSYLGRSPEYIKKHFSHIHALIHHVVQSNKAEQNKIKKDNVKEIIKGIYCSHGRLDYGILGHILGVTEETLKRHYYRLINQTLTEIKEKRS
ncbi:MAG: TniQ family protein [Candidatus Pristimantibacillus sp.]